MIYPYKLWVCQSNSDHFYRLSPDKEHYLPVFRFIKWSGVREAYTLNQIDFSKVKETGISSWAKSYSGAKWKLVYNPLTIKRAIKLCN